MNGTTIFKVNDMVIYKGVKHQIIGLIPEAGKLKLKPETGTTYKVVLIGNVQSLEDYEKEVEQRQKATAYFVNTKQFNKKESETTGIYFKLNKAYRCVIINVLKHTTKPLNIRYTDEYGQQRFECVASRYFISDEAIKRLYKVSCNKEVREQLAEYQQKYAGQESDIPVSPAVSDEKTAVKSVKTGKAQFNKGISNYNSVRV